MKKLLSLPLLTLLAVGVASAQQQLITFSTKTPFSIGNANLPAGSYQISAIGQELTTFECANTSTKASVMFEADSTDVTPSASGVTFAKYGDKLVLKSFNAAGSGGFFIPISIPERQAKKSGAKPTKVSTPAK